MEIVIPVIFVIAIIGLALATLWTGIKHREHTHAYEHIIEIVSESMTAQALQAGITRELSVRQVDTDKTLQFIKMIVEAHAHALKLSPPNFEKNEILEKAQNLENFGE